MGPGPAATPPSVASCSSCCRTMAFILPRASLEAPSDAGRSGALRLRADRLFRAQRRGGALCQRDDGGYQCFEIAPGAHAIGVTDKLQDQPIQTADDEPCQRGERQCTACSRGREGLAQQLLDDGAIPRVLLAREPGRATVAQRVEGQLILHDLQLWSGLDMLPEGGDAVANRRARA